MTILPHDRHLSNWQRAIAGHARAHPQIPEELAYEGLLARLVETQTD